MNQKMKNFLLNNPRLSYQRKELLKLLTIQSKNQGARTGSFEIKVS